MSEKTKTNSEFLMGLDGDEFAQVILRDERALILRHLDRLQEIQEGIVREKAEVAEQSGDNWHDGAFRATDIAASVVSSQASQLFGALRATAVELPDPSEERVTLGSCVEIRQRNLTYKVMIVGMANLYEASDDFEICSVKAPVARALLGRRPNDTVEVEIGGSRESLTVISVDQRVSRSLFDQRN